MASKRGVRDASLGALAAQMAGLFSPPGSVQAPFNATVLDSARGNLANEMAKYQANKAEENNGGLLGGAVGAITSGLGGFAMGGPVGAAIGATAGGIGGYTGPKQSAGSMIADTAFALQGAKSATAALPSPKPTGNMANPNNPSLMERMPQKPAWKSRSTLQNMMAGLSAGAAPAIQSLLRNITASGGQLTPLGDGTFLVNMPY